MPILDITAQVNRYKGYLGWNSFVDPAGTTIPAVEVELYIKEYPIPIRKPKMTEIATVSNLESVTYLNGLRSSKVETGVAAVFYGGTEPLQTQLSGWLITPRKHQSDANGTYSEWDPKDASGVSLNWGKMTYAEIISAYLSGRINQLPGGALQRKDPDYFITPYGQQYDSPIILTWEPSYAPNPVKTPFNMTLQLER